MRGIMKQFKKWHLLTLIFAGLLQIFSIGCNQGGKDSDGNPLLPKGVDDPNLKCDNIFTQEAIIAYNQSQNKYRVRGTGFSVHCFHEENINGKISKIEKDGYSDLEIIPKFIYAGTVDKAEPGVFKVRVSVAPINDDDKKSILRDFSFAIKDGDVLPVSMGNMVNHPSYSRIGKGSLFYMSNEGSVTVNNEIQYVYRISASDSERSLLNSRVQEFIDGQTEFELLWSPKANQMFRLIFSNLSSFEPEWSNVEAQDVMRSYVKERPNRASQEILAQAIDYAIYWDCDLNKLHAVVPELYFFADSQWQNPTIADNTLNGLLDSLKYLVKINSEHPRKAVYDNYEKIKKYLPSSKESLALALDVAQGKQYDTEQFNKLVTASEKVYPAFNDRSWRYAEIVLKKFQFNEANALGVFELTQELGLRHFISSARLEALESVANYVIGKINSGLTGPRQQVYFRIYDTFKDEFSKSLTEVTLDAWVLSDKITVANIEVLFAFIRWQREEARVYYDEATRVVDSLISARGFSPELVDLFKNCYSWLDEQISMTTSEAFKKTQEFIVTLGMTTEQFANFKVLSQWLYDEAGVYSSEAPKKAQSYLFERKITTEQTQVLKDLFKWLYDESYFYKSEGLKKAEGLLFDGSRKMDRACFEQFKDLASWYHNQLSIYRNEAYTTTERLVMQNNLSRAQTDLLKAVGEWLKNEVSLYNSDIKKKTEFYIVDKKMDQNLFLLFKKEFEDQKSKGKYNSEALKAAETKYLGL